MVLHGENLSPKCELFLFLADRAQHVESIVRPALVAKQLVLCDRYSDSTLVYQGYGRGLDKDLLREWNDFATGGLVPDLTLLLDIEPELGLARIVGKDRLDSEPLDFHQAVRQGFLAEAEQDPSRWSVVDASRDLETVVDDCWAAILRSLEARHK
jgi:dTMP kinase